MDAAWPFLVLLGIAAIDNILFILIYHQVDRERQLSWPVWPNELLKLWHLHRSMYPNSVLRALLAAGFIVFTIGSLVFFTFLLW
jgi:hypothetical protein